MKLGVMSWRQRGMQGMRVEGERQQGHTACVDAGQPQAASAADSGQLTVGACVFLGSLASCCCMRRDIARCRLAGTTADSPPRLYIMPPLMPSMMYCPLMRCGMKATGLYCPGRREGGWGGRGAVRGRRRGQSTRCLCERRQAAAGAASVAEAEQQQAGPVHRLVCSAGCADAEAGHKVACVRLRRAAAHVRCAAPVFGSCSAPKAGGSWIMSYAMPQVTIK